MVQAFLRNAGWRWALVSGKKDVNLGTYVSNVSIDYSNTDMKIRIMI